VLASLRPARKPKEWFYDLKFTQSCLIVAFQCTHKQIETVNFAGIVIAVREYLVTSAQVGQFLEDLQV
jgi:hypothetical protein